MDASLYGAAVGIPPFQCRSSNHSRNPGVGHCQVGSLTGAVAS